MKVILVLVIIVLIVLVSCTENAPVRFNASGNNNAGYTFNVQVAPIHLSADIPSTLNQMASKTVEFMQSKEAE
jgi:hypothetical protein